MHFFFKSYVVQAGWLQFWSHFDPCVGSGCLIYWKHTDQKDTTVADIKNWCVNVFCLLSVGPSIGPGPFNLTVTTGIRAALSCETSGIPPPKVSWKRNGTPLDVSQQPAAYRLTQSSDSIQIHTPTLTTNLKLMHLCCSLQVTVVWVSYSFVSIHWGWRLLWVHGCQWCWGGAQGHWGHPARYWSWVL